MLIIALFIAVGGAAAFIYNRLVQRRQLVENGWADIDVQLKRRANLVPQLVASVQGYALHEQQLFERIAEKRANALAAGDDKQQRGAAETALSRPVARLVAVAEEYPDLKASENFLKLQQELVETEEKIEMARRFYNGAVRKLNTSVQSFPNSIIAGAFGFVIAAYFEITTADKMVPPVRLDAA
ncbi:LemA family protein [Parvularcula sp. IMCC14364]|uniref:LemA family protein n=1 Tax=Parvularcula sp. IMCC14364 TaxID=3067902 RepID=UPI003558BBCF